MYGRLMWPEYDYAFREIMEEEKARIGFLSAVLNLNPEEVKEAILLEDFPSSRYGGVKSILLTVRLLLENQKEIDVEIEIQLSKYEELHAVTDRSLFYISKMYVDQLGEGEDYTKFKKCVSISILDFTLFKEDENFYSCFHILEDTRHTKYTDKMEFHVIELPKLPVELQDSSDDLLLWAKFINAEKEEEFDMVAAKNTYIRSAYEHLQVISQDEEKRLEYEARKKAIRDYNQGMREAKEEGKEEGIEEGIEIGKEKGKKENSLEIAKKMLVDGLSPEVIARYTSLSIEEIKIL